MTDINLSPEEQTNLLQKISDDPSAIVLELAMRRPDKNPVYIIKAVAKIRIGLGSSINDILFRMYNYYDGGPLSLEEEYYYRIMSQQTK